MLRWLHAGVLFTVALVAQTAWAQAAQPASKEPPAGYTIVLRDAIAEADAQNWPEAKTLFEKAHAMFPNARTLRGLGMVAFAARRYVDALQYLNGALTHPVRPLTADQRAHVQGLVEQSQTFIAHFEVRLDPADAQLLVDGQPAQLDDAHAMLLDPGEHEVVVRAPEYVEVVRRLLVKGGEHGTLEISLQPPASEVAATPTAEPVTAPEPVQDQPPRPRLWTWVAAGGAVAFGAAAVGIYLSGVSERDGISKKCMMMSAKACTPAQRDSLVDKSGIGTKETLSTVMWIAAGASLVTASVLFFVEGRPVTETASETPAVAVGIAPGGLAVAGTF